jgi:hypothetical protein
MPKRTLFGLEGSVQIVASNKKILQFFLSFPEFSCRQPGKSGINRIGETCGY